MQKLKSTKEYNVEAVAEFGLSLSSNFFIGNMDMHMKISVKKIYQPGLDVHWHSLSLQP